MKKRWSAIESRPEMVANIEERDGVITSQRPVFAPSLPKSFGSSALCRTHEIIRLVRAPAAFVPRNLRVRTQGPRSRNASGFIVLARDH